MDDRQDEAFRRRNLLWGLGAEVVIPVVVGLLFVLYVLIAE